MALQYRSHPVLWPIVSGLITQLLKFLSYLYFSQRRFTGLIWQCRPSGNFARSLPQVSPTRHSLGNQIMTMRIGKPGALFLWAFVCLTAFFVVQTALQAYSRTVYAFSRDRGLPDGGYFAVMNEYTGTPIRAIWIATLVAILPGLLDFASPVAANAIFSLTAMALDLSYIIPIFL